MTRTVPTTVGLVPIISAWQDLTPPASQDILTGRDKNGPLFQPTRLTLKEKTRKEIHLEQVICAVDISPGTPGPAHILGGQEI